MRQNFPQVLRLPADKTAGQMRLAAPADTSALWMIVANEI